VEKKGGGNSKKKKGAVGEITERKGGNGMFPLG